MPDPFPASWRRAVKYPWSYYGPGALRMLAAQPVEEVPRILERVNEDLKDEDDELLSDPGFEAAKRRMLKSMKAVCRWLKGDKQLIKISSMAADTLADLEPRWFYLPKPGDKLYGEGIIFEHVLHGQLETFVFAAPLGDLIAPRLALCVWLKSNYTAEDGTKYYSWEPAWVPGIVDQHWLERELERVNEDLLRAMQEETSREEKDQVTSRAFSALLVQIVVNALAAMNYEMTMPVVTQSKKQRKQSRNPTGGVPNVRILRLDDNGMAVWKRRILDRTAEPNRRGPDQQPRAKPSLYTVGDHKGIRWVLEPRKGEEVLEEKPNKDGTRTLYAVRRKVSGWTAGGELKPKTTRLKHGPDDLNIH